MTGFEMKQLFHAYGKVKVQQYRIECAIADIENSGIPFEVIDVHLMDLQYAVTGSDEMLRDIAEAHLFYTSLVQFADVHKWFAELVTDFEE